MIIAGVIFTIFFYFVTRALAMNYYQNISGAFHGIMVLLSALCLFASVALTLMGAVLHLVESL